jgi:SAM-dependent methyltransferase
MPGTLRAARRLLTLFGFDPARTVRTLRALPGYLHDLHVLRSQRNGSTVEFPLGKLYPCLDDRQADGGVAKGHYFHQDLLVARKVFGDNPRRHVDIGSRIDGFVAHVAAFRPLEVFDVRRLSGRVPNIRFRQVDLMTPLDGDLIDYCDSLSCLHALEHFGLGRYGEPVRAEGHLIGLENIHRILRPEGKFYLSAPIGPQRLEFNAHRVFSVRYLLKLLQMKYEILSFSLVDDRGDLLENVPLSDENVEANFRCRYGCGIFEMVKR